MAYRLPLRLVVLSTFVWLFSGCGDPHESEEGAPATQRVGGANYGEARIGYKGGALSRVAAMVGDESIAETTPIASAPWAGSSAPSAGFAGGTLAGATSLGSSPGVGASAPNPVVAFDAGVALAPDASPRFDAASMVDGQPVQDAQVVVDAQPAVDAPVAAQLASDSAQVQPEASVDAQTVASDSTILAPDTQYEPTVHADAGAQAQPDAALATADAQTPATTALVSENPFFLTADSAVSTFAIDVDTGSYTLSRASLNAGHLPDPKSVRVEEFLNYFHFHYAQPQGDDPLSVYTELGKCPWNAERQLLLVGVQGQEVELRDQPPANLVFLLDVSGSMNVANKLPLLKKGFRMLVSQLRDQDRVAIVTYAGRETVALESTPGSQKDVILRAIDRVEAGGATNGQGGIQKAYELAQKTFMKSGNNRVLLATDGDFNVGISQTNELVNFISEKRKTGVYLTVYGFGAAWDGGNYRDDVGEQLADHGDGIYFYIDSPEEARRAFLESVSGSLLTVAKDVKLQVELNPQLVKAYRLIGYENRVLANAAFSNDSVDGGELGAGLSVTALFEIIPAGAAGEVPVAKPGSVPELGGADAGGVAETFEALSGDNLLEVRLRYKQDRSIQSKLLRERFGRDIMRETETPKFLFAAGVSELAMQLRHSQYLDTQRSEPLLDQIAQTRALDQEGAIEELYQLAQKALSLRSAP